MTVLDPGAYSEALELARRRPAPVQQRPVGVGNANAAAVKGLQQRLSELGYGLNVDGVFGPDTQRALKEFQQSVGLPASGQVGMGTFLALQKAKAPTPNPADPSITAWTKTSTGGSGAQGTTQIGQGLAALKQEIQGTSQSAGGTPGTSGSTRSAGGAVGGAGGYHYNPLTGTYQQMTGQQLQQVQQQWYQKNPKTPMPTSPKGAKGAKGAAGPKSGTVSNPIGSTQLPQTPGYTWDQPGQQAQPGAMGGVGGDFETAHPRVQKGQPGAGRFAAKNGDTGQGVANIQTALNTVGPVPAPQPAVQQRRQPPQQSVGAGVAGLVLSRAEDRADAPSKHLKVDGEFGPKTETMVRHFQVVNGLKVDGIVGQKTSKALRRRLSRPHLGIVRMVGPYGSMPSAEGSPLEEAGETPAQEQAEDALAPPAGP